MYIYKINTNLNIPLPCLRPSWISWSCQWSWLQTHYQFGICVVRFVYSSLSLFAWCVALTSEVVRISLRDIMLGLDVIRIMQLTDRHQICCTGFMIYLHHSWPSGFRIIVRLLLRPSGWNHLALCAISLDLCPRVWLCAQHLKQQFYTEPIGLLKYQKNQLQFFFLNAVVK